ncbi:hypothetical protein Syun_008905 [Stephania yunnanensis]|uniref:Uncharacterized protein n=1 Tax=Stephania yunnanensis TaxID=152371 RepID=A0AAP0PRT2_9MAGN
MALSLVFVDFVLQTPSFFVLIWLVQLVVSKFSLYLSMKAFLQFSNLAMVGV